MEEGSPDRRALFFRLVYPAEQWVAASHGCGATHLGLADAAS